MSDTIAVETAGGPARFRFRLDDGGRIAVEHDGSIHTEWFLHDGDSAWKPWRYYDDTPPS
jgi:hypothetical protein